MLVTAIYKNSKLHCGVKSLACQQQTQKRLKFLSADCMPDGIGCCGERLRGFSLLCRAHASACTNEQALLEVYVLREQWLYVTWPSVAVRDGFSQHGAEAQWSNAGQNLPVQIGAARWIGRRQVQFGASIRQRTVPRIPREYNRRYLTFIKYPNIK